MLNWMLSFSARRCGYARDSRKGLKNCPRPYSSLEWSFQHTSPFIHLDSTPTLSIWGQRVKKLIFVHDGSDEGESSEIEAREESINQNLAWKFFLVVVSSYTSKVSVRARIPYVLFFWRFRYDHALYANGKVEWKPLKPYRSLVFPVWLMRS